MSIVRRILAKFTPTATVERRRVRAFAIQERTPPAEIQLWSTGDNPTDYGIHKWTERSANEVLAVYNDRGNPILIDIEHNGPALDDGEPTETAGYAKLELRDGAPWLVFDWSATGAEQIATGQRRFLSPEYDVDTTTNEIIRLYRVSLVADPATHNARILASAANQERNAMDPTLAAILSILNSVADPGEAITAIKDYVANLEGTAPPTTDDVPADPDPAFAAADDKPGDEKKPIAATAPAAPVAAATPKPTPTPAPVAASIPTTAKPSDEETASIRAAREHAERSENALRDMLIAQHGHRLQPSIRTWASTQKLDVVKGLVAAAPDLKPIPTKVTATRGEGHGTGVGRKGLEGKDLEELQRGMGTFKASTPTTPHRNERGDFVLPTVPPSEFRKVQAAAAKEGK